MESPATANERPRRAEVSVCGPDGVVSAAVALSGRRVTVGRLPEVNDIVLQPDPDHFVSRAGHCALEAGAGGWFLVDGGSVNGTFLRREDSLRRVTERTVLHDGDAICVLASITGAGDRRFFELAFQADADSQVTHAAAIDRTRAPAPACLRYDADEARLVLVRGDERHEIKIRAQAHRLIRYMAQRNAAGDGAPALCTHSELMDAVWADEPLHAREELTKLMWELRRKLEPFGAEHLIENERRLGYRLLTRPE